MKKIITVSKDIRYIFDLILKHCGNDCYVFGGFVHSFVHDCENHKFNDIDIKIKPEVSMINLIEILEKELGKEIYLVKYKNTISFRYKNQEYDIINNVINLRYFEKVYLKSLEIDLDIFPEFCETGSDKLIKNIIVKGFTNICYDNEYKHKLKYVKNNSSQFDNDLFVQYGFFKMKDLYFNNLSSNLIICDFNILEKWKENYTRFLHKYIVIWIDRNNLDSEYEKLPSTFIDCIINPITNKFELILDWIYTKYPLIDQREMIIVSDHLSDKDLSMKFNYKPVLFSVKDIDKVTHYKKSPYTFELYPFYFYLSKQNNFIINIIAHNGNITLISDNYNTEFAKVFTHRIIESSLEGLEDILIKYNYDMEWFENIFMSWYKKTGIFQSIFYNNKTILNTLLNILETFKNYPNHENFRVIYEKDSIVYVPLVETENEQKIFGKTFEILVSSNHNIYTDPLSIEHKKYWLKKMFSGLIFEKRDTTINFESFKKAEIINSNARLMSDPEIHLMVKNNDFENFKKYIFNLSDSDKKLLFNQIQIFLSDENEPYDNLIKILKEKNITHLFLDFNNTITSQWIDFKKKSIHEISYTIRPFMGKLILHLLNNNVKIIIVTINPNIEKIKEFVAYNFSTFKDEIIISSDSIAQNKNNQISNFIKKLNIRPNNVLFMDDILDNIYLVSKLGCFTMFIDVFSLKTEKQMIHKLYNILK